MVVENRRILGPFHGYLLMMEACPEGRTGCVEFAYNDHPQVTYVPPDSTEERNETGDL